MKSLTAAKFIWKSSPRLLWHASRTLIEMYRAAFVCAASTEGVYQELRKGPQSSQALHDAMGLQDSVPELEAWLDLGVSLGELGKDDRGYSLRGQLSRRLSDPQHDAFLAFLQVRVLVFFDYILHTPAALKARRKFPPNEDHGPMFARSSRVAETLLVDLIERVVPPRGALRMLEVGCGSGVYIQHACQRNPDLHVVGLELTRTLADFARDNMRAGNLNDRVEILSTDVRAYEAHGGFDIVTFYNLIYYFPLVERVALLRRLGSFLKPDGELVVASLTRASDPSAASMHLWSSMSEGAGPLPRGQELREQLEAAGFAALRSEELIPGFWVFFARLQS